MDLVLLIGFMRIVSPRLINAYPNRILNVHPSLLPDVCSPVAFVIDQHFFFFFFGNS